MIEQIKARQYGVIYPSPQEALFAQDHYSRVLKLAAMVSEYTLDELMDMPARETVDLRNAVNEQIAMPFDINGNVEGVVDTGEVMEVTLSEPLAGQFEVVHIRYPNGHDLTPRPSPQNKPESEFDRSITMLQGLINEIGIAPKAKSALLDMPVCDYLRMTNAINLHISGFDV